MKSYSDHNKPDAPENSNLERLFSPDWLRSFKGYENISDEEAENEINTLQILSEIICRHIATGKPST